jgi:uncharacterized membrane protein YhaH (DUF805 family)
MKHFIYALKNYNNFSSRSRRREYWTYILFFYLFAFIVTVADALIGQQIFLSIYFLLMVVPSIAVGVRRMHDVGKSGWFLLVPFYNIILFFTDGTIGENKYGSDPKGREKVVSIQTAESKKSKMAQNIVGQIVETVIENI